jgi:hypothetical protein
MTDMTMMVKTMKDMIINYAEGQRIIL